MKKKLALLVGFVALCATIAAGTIKLASSSPEPVVCVKPVTFHDSEGTAAIAAVEAWAAELLATGGYKVKDGLNTYVQLTAAAGDKSITATKIVALVTVIDEPVFGFFGVEGGEAWREYRVVLTRDCLGDDWRVAAAKLQHDKPRAKTKARTKGVIPDS